MADDPSLPWGSRKKFTRDGESKAYYGHSVIAQLPADSPLRPTLNAIHSALSAHPLADTVFPNECLLPADSWHMTVFICVRDRERGEEVMPRVGPQAEAAVRDIGLDGEYEDWLAYTSQQVEALSQVLPEEAQPPYVMNLSRQIPPIKHTIGLKLELTNAGGDLWAVREELGDATGIRKFDFDQEGYVDSYKFHVSIAYTVREPSPAEEAEIKAVIEEVLADAPATVEFSKAALCSFEDMQDFTEEVVLADADDVDDDDDDDDF